MTRMSEDEFFMNLADAYSRRATCKKRQVGCIIAKNGELVSGGYNGSPRHLPHCIDEGCLSDENGKCLRCIHAEVNAIIHTSPDARDGATMYVTCEPCDKCQLLIINSGITRLVFKNAHKPKVDWLSQAPWIEVVNLDLI